MAQPIALMTIIRNLSVFLINPSGSGQTGDLTLFQASLPPWPVHYLQEFKALGREEGNAAFAAIVKILISELTVGVCPRAD